MLNVVLIVGKSYRLTDPIYKVAGKMKTFSKIKNYYSFVFSLPKPLKTPKQK